MQHEPQQFVGLYYVYNFNCFRYVCACSMFVYLRTRSLKILDSCLLDRVWSKEQQKMHASEVYVLWNIKQQINEQNK